MGPEKMRTVPGMLGCIDISFDNSFQKCTSMGML